MVETFVAKFEAALGDLELPYYRELIGEGAFGRDYGPWSSRLERSITSLQDYLRSTFDAWLERDGPQEDAVQSAIWFLDDGNLKESLELLDAINLSLRTSGGEFESLLAAEASVVARDIEREVDQLFAHLTIAVRTPIPLLAENLLAFFLRLRQGQGEDYMRLLSRARDVCNTLWTQGPTVKKVDSFLKLMKDLAARAKVDFSLWNDNLFTALVEERNDLEIRELWDEHTA